jgi:hypothetical protein
MRVDEEIRMCDRSELGQLDISLLERLILWCRGHRKKEQPALAHLAVDGDVRDEVKLIHVTA